MPPSHHILHACAAFAVIWGASGSAGDFPKVELSSERLKVNVYLPDSHKGYYRACRFDWSSMVGPVTLDDSVQFFTDWRVPHNPTTPEHGIGLAEEFGMPGADIPLGFVPAMGASFLKIGVGVCVNDDPGAYDFFHAYPVAKANKWRVHLSDDKSTLTMKTSMKFEDYGYEYEKTMRVNGTTLHIHHDLKNTGVAAFSQWTYSHNLFNVPDTPVGSGFGFEIPVKLAKSDFSTCVGEVTSAISPSSKLPSPRFKFSEDLNSTNVMYCDFDGKIAKEKALKNRFSVRDANGNGFDKVGSDHLQGLHFYAEKSVLAIEPFSRITLNSKESTAWSQSVTFVAGDNAVFAAAEHLVETELVEHVFTPAFAVPALFVSIMVAMLATSRGWISTDKCKSLCCLTGRENQGNTSNMKREDSIDSFDSFEDSALSDNNPKKGGCYGTCRSP